MRFLDKQISSSLILKVEEGTITKFYYFKQLPAAINLNVEDWPWVV